MESAPFEWHDYLRVASIIICLISVIFLVKSWVQNHRKWSPKTVDYWYALTAWSAAGIAICIEGIIRNLGFGPRSIFIIVASTITLKAVMSKGSWGDGRAR